MAAECSGKMMDSGRGGEKWDGWWRISWMAKFWRLKSGRVTHVEEGEKGGAGEEREGIASDPTGGKRGNRERLD